MKHLVLNFNYVAKDIIRMFHVIIKKQKIQNT